MRRRECFALPLLLAGCGSGTEGEMEYTISPSPITGSGKLNTPVPSYTAGTWTPVFTFTTLGNLSTTYFTQLGFYQRVADLVAVHFVVDFSVFTHTSASGNAIINGLPYVSVFDAALNYGTVSWEGITKASYTQVVPYVGAGVSSIQFSASGSGQSRANIAAADMPSGGTPSFFGVVLYRV